jgi:nodulation protein E
MDCSTLRFQNGAQVRGFDALKHFEGGKDAQIDRFAQFSVVAAREALRDSGLDLTADLREHGAIVCGSAVGGQAALEAGFEDLYVAGRGRVHPLTIPKTMANAGASQISMDLRVSGPTYTVSTACSSSNHAIGQAFRMVRDGDVEMAVTGGSEAPFTIGLLKAWEAMRVIAPDTCRPFSKDRRGMILGEGGAMMILEPLDAAQARGARIYAEVCGSGMSSDAHHLTQPTVDGPARAMRAALRDAGLQPEQVGYINAHGTGTPGNDPTETRAIREVFGAHADKIAVSSTKSLHGHALGAAGALEAVATILALHRGILPPTANYNERDPECDLDYIPNQPRAGWVEAALSNSFAFGGLNAVVAFRAYR